MLAVINGPLRAAHGQRSARPRWKAAAAKGLNMFAVIDYQTITDGRHPVLSCDACPRRQSAPQVEQTREIARRFNRCYAIESPSCRSLRRSWAMLEGSRGAAVIQQQMELQELMRDRNGRR